MKLSILCLSFFIFGFTMPGWATQKNSKEKTKVKPLIAAAPSGSNETASETSGAVQSAPPPGSPSTRPSLREMGARIQKSEEITQLFRDSLKDPSVVTAAQVQQLEKPNLPLIREFKSLATESTSFVRGEIEDPQVMSQTLALQQLSLLRIQTWGQESAPRFMGLIKDESSVWFQFAADLPYNEASLVGLKMAGVIRSLLIDELERIEKQRGAEMGQDEMWLNWMLRLRTPWPVDRMILTEARRSLSPPSIALAEKVALQIQKDPYLSVESALKRIPGGKPKEVEILKSLWRVQDMTEMKTEINRLQTLRLRLAARLFEKRKGHPPTNVQELVKERLLAHTPVDYLTGHPMLLPQPGMTPVAPKNP